MTPAARLAALIELTDQLLQEWQQENPRPAEQVIKQYTRERRYIGGGDRRALQESVFGLLRKMGGLDLAGLPHNGRSLALCFLRAQGQTLEEIAALCSAEKYAPAALNAAERNLLAEEHELKASRLPVWLEELLRAQYGEEADALIEALLQPAPLDLRVNRLKADVSRVQNELARSGIETRRVEGLPDALEAARHAPVIRTQAYEEGLVEIQDRGSQAVVAVVANVLAEQGKAPLTIIDYCAGAGGKSLALASKLGNKARIIAWDADPQRLAELEPRARRAGASCISLWKKEPSAMPKADLVLLDVPCSGSGTIRRHPDLPWRLSPAKLEHYSKLQRQVLKEAAPLVKPGGYLYYVTCSLLETENFQCVNGFLTNNSNFRVVTPAQIWDKGAIKIAPWLEFLPHRQGSDGFFAVLLKNQ